MLELSLSDRCFLNKDKNICIKKKELPSVSSVKLKLSLDDRSWIELFDTDGDTTAYNLNMFLSNEIIKQ